MKGGMLKFWILRIVSEHECNGAEVMQRMAIRTGGHWRPSPGSVYPTLSKMESEKLLLRHPDGKYGITKAGLNELKEYDSLVRGLWDEDSENDIIEETIGNLKYIIETKGKKNFSAEVLERLDAAIREYISKRGEKD